MRTALRGRCLSPRRSCAVPLSVQAVPERGRVSRSRRAPQPRRGSSQSSMQRPTTSAGRAAA